MVRLRILLPAAGLVLVAGCGSSAQLGGSAGSGAAGKDRKDGCPTISEVQRAMPPSVSKGKSTTYRVVSSTHQKLPDGRQCGYALAGLQIDFTVRSGGAALYDASLATASSNPSGPPPEKLLGAGDEAVIDRATTSYARLIARFGTDVVDMQLNGPTPSPPLLVRLAKLAAS